MIGWSSDETRFSELLSQHGQHMAVLCGAGVSTTSKLPSAEQLLNFFLERIGADAIQLPSSGSSIDLRKFLTSEGARLPERVPLRFEGLMQVIQRIVDKELAVLDRIYFANNPDGPKP